MNSPRPSALMISPVLPKRSGNGLAQRCSVFLQALESIFDVSLLIVPAFGPVNEEANPKEYEPSTKVFTVPATTLPDTQFQLLSRIENLEARLEAFRNYGKPSLSAGLSADALKKSSTLLAGQTFDLIHVQRAYCAAFGWALAKAQGDTPLLTIDIDEIDSDLQRRIAQFHQVQGQDQSAAWCLAEADALEDSNDEYLGKFDQRFMSSERESKNMLAKHGNKSVCISNSVAIGHSLQRQKKRDERTTILFVGSLDYLPNDDGLVWFLSEVLDLIDDGEHWQMNIIGAGASQRLKKLVQAKGVSLLGWVDDLDEHYAAADICIVPIRFGGGTNIKLVEAAAKKCPVVTTSVGIEGLAFKDMVHVRVADTAKDFALAINDARTKSEESEHLVANAFDLVTGLYERNRVIELAAAEFKEVGKPILKRRKN